MLSGSINGVSVRSMLRVFAVLLLVASMLTAAGCSGGGGGSVTGTYVAEQKGPDGKSMKFKLQLKGGGVAVLTLTGPDGESMPPVNGTYTVEGEKITTVLDNDKDVLTIKGETLITDFFDEKLVYKKQ